MVGRSTKLLYNWWECSWYHVSLHNKRALQSLQVICLFLILFKFYYNSDLIQLGVFIPANKSLNVTEIGNFIYVYIYICSFYEFLLTALLFSYGIIHLVSIVHGGYLSHSFSNNPAPSLIPSL